MKTIKTAILSYLYVSLSSLGGTAIFADDFTGPGVNTNYWHIPTWLHDGDGTYLGQTQLRCVPSALPAIGNSNISVTVQSFNPTAPVTEPSMFGTDLISNGPFFVGNGLTITARLKVDSVKKGTVFAFFLYSPPADPLSTAHDEIDFEFLGNQPDHFNTNIFGNEPLGVGNPQSIPYSPQVGATSIADYHTYQIVWLRNQVSWYVDGILVRTVTPNESPIPQGPMYLHFNAWVPDAGWPDAYSPEISAVSSQSRNQVWSMSVDSARVESDPQVLTTIEIDPTSSTLGVTATQKFEASAIDQNENTIAETPIKLVWASDNPAIAKIDASGLMTAVAPGTAHITASCGGVVSEPSEVNVPPVSVVIKSVPAIGKKGNAMGLVNGILPVDCRNWRIATYINVYGGWWTKPSYKFPLTAISKNGAWATNIVTGGSDAYAGEIRSYLVPLNGFTVPVCAGESEIPGDLRECPYDSVVRSLDAGGSVSPALWKLSVAPNKLSLKAGGAQQQMFATLLDTKKNAVSAGVSWSSSNPAVATVDSNGLVTPVAYNKTAIVITATVIVNPKIKATAVVAVLK